MTKCASCKADVNSKECTDCSNATCLPDMSKCSGLPLSSTVMFSAKKAGECMNKNDFEDLTKETFAQAAVRVPQFVSNNVVVFKSNFPQKTCIQNCGFDGGKLAQCLHDKTGLSNGCSSCFGNFDTCIGMKCQAECKKGPKECEACERKFCVPAFSDCSGLSSFHQAISQAMSLVSDIAGPSKACINPSDIREMAKYTFSQAIVSFSLSF